MVRLQHKTSVNQEELQKIGKKHALKNRTNFIIVYIYITGCFWGWLSIFMFQKQILALSIPMLNGNLFKFTNSTYKYLGKQIGLNLNLKNNFALSPLYRRTYSKGEALSRSRSRDMSMVPKSFANLEPPLVVLVGARIFNPNLTILW